jgi:hypothetical protein
VEGIESIDIIKNQRLEGVEYKLRNEMVTIKIMIVMIIVSLMARHRKRRLLGRHYPCFVLLF